MSDSFRATNVFPEVFFLWDDSALGGIDLADPTRGNPGIGATEYLFPLLAHALLARKVCRPVFFHRNANVVLPVGIRSVIIPNGPQPWPLGAVLALPEGSTVVARPGADLQEALQARPNGVRAIAWAHNHLRGPMLRWLAVSDQVAAVVNVGFEQHRLSMQGGVSHKSVVIPNLVPPPRDVCAITARGPHAVYLGALFPNKGFHRLARLWPEIWRRVPEARLDVIGSGEVYDPEGRRGPLGIAEPYYERALLRLLGGNPMSLGVVFHGRLGEEKWEILARARVGLPNPTGFTETFCVAAAEMASYGAAVVAPQRWGFLDTVIDKETGYLVNSDAEYVKVVSDLLSKPEIAARMGVKGAEFVTQTFDAGEICALWHKLFVAIGHGMPIPTTQVERPHGRYPYKIAFRFPRLKGITQNLIDMADSAYGWYLRQVWT